MKQRKCVAVVATIACLLLLFAAGCGSSSRGTSSSAASKPSTTSASTQTTGSSGNSQEKSSYEDSRWPTTYGELLSIPETNRWYSARKHINSQCTLVGPVINVYQAKDKTGQPIFINVGDAYGEDEGFTLLVWANAYDDFSEMINDVDDGNAWLKVTGYLSDYEGRAQFDCSDGPLSYTWWTNVR